MIVAIVPESVEPWEPSKGRIVRCFQFLTGSKMYFWIGPVTVANGASPACRYWPTTGTNLDSLGMVRACVESNHRVDGVGRPKF